jgi:hypothetical protein
MASAQSIALRQRVARNFWCVGLCWRGQGSLHVHVPFSAKPAEVLSTSERIRRSELRRDNLGALARGVSLEQRSKQREEFANEWSAWLRQRMDACNCDDPTAILPDALARLQQLAEDSALAAIKELKKTLMGALK